MARRNSCGKKQTFSSVNDEANTSAGEGKCRKDEGEDKCAAVPSAPSSTPPDASCLRSLQEPPRSGEHLCVCVCV